MSFLKTAFPFSSTFFNAFNPLASPPDPTGPYPVGTHDLEWAPQDFRLGNALGSHAHPETVLARLYYPAVLPSGSEKLPRDRWLPEYDYAKGYANFASIPPALSPLFAYPLAGLTTPTYSNLPIISSRSLPVILFSHGLAGCRTTYSHLCVELASRGFLVCAVEHRDGTAPFTASRRGDRVRYPYDDWKKREQEKEVLTMWRKGQVAHRVSELEHAWEVLRLAATEGTVPENFMEVEGAFKIGDLEGRVDFKRVVVAGHSFGAVTSLRALARFPKGVLRAAVALDPWMLPHMEEDAAPEGAEVFVANSESWEKWRENFEAVERYVHAAETRKKGRIYHLTIKGTGHQNASDFPTVAGAFGKLAIIRSGLIAPVRALEIQAKLVTGFLRTCLGGGDDGRLVRENLEQEAEVAFVERTGIASEEYVVWH